MVIQPTRSGGRLIYGKVGKVHQISAEWSADGVLISASGPPCMVNLDEHTPWGDYRLHWEGGELREASIVIHTPDDYEPPVPTVKGVGDHLYGIIRERLPKARKIKRCGCGEWIAKMNAWGPDGCEEHADEIVSHLVSQADKLGRLVGLAVRFIPGMQDEAQRDARVMLNEAIARSTLPSAL